MFLKRFFTILLLTSLSTFGQHWEYDFETAKVISKDKNQNIVLVFTGSDWCPPCIRLEKNILASSQFVEFSSDNVVLLRADFPKRKKNALSKEQLKKNQELADIYNPRLKFPVVLVLDAEGRVKGKKSGYHKNTSVADYISFINSFKI